MKKSGGVRHEFPHRAPPSQTPLACQHQRPELIFFFFCEAGQAPPPSGITCLTPACGSHAAQTINKNRQKENGEEKNKEYRLCIWGFLPVVCRRTKHLRSLFPRRVISCENFWRAVNRNGEKSCSNSACMTLACELIKWGLWMIRCRLSKVRALSYSLWAGL